jgi:predicted glycoside hydrolase/deacetylase ChbG (UPF0249 family)
LIAQVERTLDAGVDVSHFDSHHFIHTRPMLFPVLKSLQKRFDVRKCRSTINLFPAGERLDAVRLLTRLAFRFGLRYFYHTASPEGLGDFRDFYTALKAHCIPRFRQLELMVHPGTSNPAYNDEVSLLRSDWRQRLPADVILGNYRAI